ncbi:probable 2-oxoglutarate-dependent dioxygenase AOP1 [Actinidia eriantha]|uniref:probable 2-oxoglutarate-dependent dioxygenase AOP1 n=1 Tax=Actinidia eriantha TaxID=165200 RepID=UPI0025841633|nr:probable 2-oxoglutarate-dependent dioxygenase AOP1 [Actinidia eriantha]
MVSPAFSKLPTIKFDPENSIPGSGSWAPTCESVRRALEEYGCFVAEYNGVCSELGGAVFRALEELFDLPIERKALNTSGKPYFGYVGQIPEVPLYESMGMDEANTLEGSQSFTRLMWPNGNQHFCETVYAYAKQVAELEQTVQRMVFESYGIDKKSFDSHNIESTNYLIRFTKYRGPQTNDETNVGLTSHTDKSFITILHQNQVNGLEVMPRNGDEWIGFEQLPSSFVVMAGDAFLAWSNNRIHCPPHRVVMRGDKARYSLGLFSFKRGTIHIPEELIDDEHPQQFKPFDNLGMLSFAYENGEVRPHCCAKEYCGV